MLRPKDLAFQGRGGRGAAGPVARHHRHCDRRRAREAPQQPAGCVSPAHPTGLTSPPREHDPGPISAQELIGLDARTDARSGSRHVNLADHLSRTRRDIPAGRLPPQWVRRAIQCPGCSRESRQSGDVAGAVAKGAQGHSAGPLTTRPADKKTPGSLRAHLQQDRLRGGQPALPTASTLTAASVTSAAFAAFASASCCTDWLAFS